MLRVRYFWLTSTSDDPGAPPSFADRLKKIGWGPVVLTVLFVCLYILADRSGLDFRYNPWASNKVIDIELLKDDAAASIWRFHARSPLYNTMLALLLKADALLPLPIHHMHQFIYFCMAWCSLLLVYGAFRRLTKLAGWGTFFGVCTALNPMLYRLCFIPASTLFVHVAFCLVLYMSVRFALSRSLRDYLWFGISLFFLSWTRAAYHPLFCFAYLGGLTGMLWWIYRPGWNRIELILRTGVIVFLVLAWPVKNSVHFGMFSNSSWVGYNFARNTPVRREFEQRLGDVAALQKMGEGLHPVLSHAVKSEAAGGSRNWNHIWFPRTSAEFQKKSMEWRRQNGEMYRKWAICQYFMTTPACFYQVYSSPPLLQDMVSPGLFRSFVRAYERVLFPDLRPGVDSMLFGDAYIQQDLMDQDGNKVTRALTVDQFVNLMASVSGCAVRPLRVSLYGLVVLPGLVLAASLFLLVRIRRPDELDAVAATVLFTIFWVLLTTLVSDGIEGARMRYGTAGVNLVLFWYVGYRACSLMRRWVRRQT
jgi:hypothetical protein